MGFLGAVLSVAGVGMATATPAVAHTSLAEATPGIGLEVDQVTEIELQFADDLDVDGTPGIRLMTPDEQTVVAEGDAEVRDPRTIALRVEAELPGNGQYLVDWQIVAADGDEQGSRYAFTYTGADADFVAASEPDTTPDQGTRRNALFVVGSAAVGLLLVMVGRWGMSRFVARRE